MGQSIPKNAVTAVQSDTVNLPTPVVVYIGGDGNLKVTTEGGQETTFVGLSAGDILPVSALRIWSTGTTATNLLMLW
jgi:hypothetical protein